MTEHSSIPFEGDRVSVVSLVHRSPPLHANRTKRVFDFIGALLLIIFFLPAMAIIAAIIRLDGGPALYRHRRIGADGMPFDCLKFRTMHVNSQALLDRLLREDPEARAEWDRDFKLRRDPRITLVGNFLRKSSLDELPQLFNVLHGDMSLVGPRPIVEKEIPRYQDRYDYYKQCRPGLTGAWQISGRTELSYDERVELDYHYVVNWSIRADIAIILKTPLVVLRGYGAY